MNLWQYCFSTAEAKILYCDVLAEGRSALCPSINADWWNCVSVIMCRPSSSPITIPAGWHVPSRNDIVATRHIQLSLKGMTPGSAIILFCGGRLLLFLGQWALLELIGQSMDEEWLRELRLPGSWNSPCCMRKRTVRSPESEGHGRLWRRFGQGCCRKGRNLQII